MTISIGLSPLGTARVALGANDQTNDTPGQDAALLAWLQGLREPIETEYNLESEILAIAWELTRWQPGLSAKEYHALSLLILLALVQLRQGSTRITLRGPKGDELRLDFARRMLGKTRPAGGLPKLEDSEEVSDIAALMAELAEPGRASTLIGDPADFKPLVVAGDHLYIQKMLHLESELVAALRRKLEERAQDWRERAINDALGDVVARPPTAKGHPLKLTDEQREAVRASVRSPIAIISGGPGTGKTTIVVSILRVLSRLGVALEEIALAAPTGKAASRMLEAIEDGLRGISDPAPADRAMIEWPEPLKPRTLHRLLGYSPSSGRFYHHENNRLAERVVIVDEASMIDLTLMERLVRALREDGRLILLGDARQLPSVEAGAVLRDLVNVWKEDPRRSPPAVVLEKSHRAETDEHGRNLLGVARHIDQGEIPRFDVERSGDDVVVKRDSAHELQFGGVEFIAAPANQVQVERFLQRWEAESAAAHPELARLIEHTYMVSADEFTADDQAKLGEIFNAWASFRILCVTRVLPTGSERINEVCHGRTLAQLESASGDDRFVAGDPVMMQVNDYGRMIFNGDQGVIVRVVERGQARPQSMAVFRRSDRFAAFHLEALRSSLALSYAITVHKAQGSEFDRVALVLPDRDVSINTREILYTALTRARKSAVILGTREIFEAGITRTCDRDSGIVEKLRA
jgi:exodeoxyribonuclease V alpha subunit